MLHHPSIPERMAEALIAMRAEGHEDHQDIRLIEIYGFTGREIAAHGDEAKRLANRKFVRHVEDDRPAYDRAGRLAEARGLALALLPGEGVLHARLRNAGFSNAELADFWGELVAALAEKARSLRCPQ